MTGIDTTWLVDLEVLESHRHAGALSLFQAWRKERSSLLAVYYHVFLEFQHVVTDRRRFERPLSMRAAIERTAFWMDQERVRVLYPTEASFKRAQLWLSAWDLGRKRLVDTHMAAAYAEAGVDRLLTANPADFRTFEVFDLPEYG
jgi:predicted nucleic acid-binding protein